MIRCSILLGVLVTICAYGQYPTIVQVVNTTPDAYTYLGRNNNPGAQDSYLYQRITSNFHIIGSNTNGDSYTLRKIGFAVGGVDHESDVKMTIDTQGNVGIATTTPGEKLDVNGRILSRMINGGGWDIALGASDGNGLLIGRINGNTNTSSDWAHMLYRNNNGAIYYGYNASGVTTTQI